VPGAFRYLLSLIPFLFSNFYFPITEWPVTG
jgi:hypothetical protein